MGSTMSTLLASSAIFLALPSGALATNGADFSNNLFSDLGPVLALFGEQVTKQFMSQSMSWLEDVIFAMAPLGIITAIISAVRVGGPNWLKAVVGRARESEAAVEIELMSSTSHEVCELWNGQTIVRVIGSPDIVEILYFKDMAGDKNKCGLFTLEMAKKEGLLKNVNETRRDGSTQAEENQPMTAINRGAPGTKNNIFSRIFSRTSSQSSSTDWDLASIDVENAMRLRLRNNPQNTSRPTSGLTSGPTPGPTIRDSAPNISFNIGKIKRQRELWLFAILGFVLQFGSLVFIGVTHYHPKINLREGENSGYAYPLMALGTLFLVMGMMACSHVVQVSSVETTWVAEKKFRILWLQKSAIVNDQGFGSYALFTDERNTLTTSRRPTDTPLSSPNLTLVGSFISLAGFVTQFVGIRALHWSASIAQLVVTLAMTAVRTWIRRNMSARPRAKVLPKSFDINWLTVKFATSLEWLWEHDGDCIPEYDGDDDLNWEVLTAQRYRGYEASQEAQTEPMTDAKRMLEMREELGHLIDWKGSSYPFALGLVKCLQSLLSCFVTSRSITLKDDFASSTVFRWALPVKVGRKIEQMTITARRSKDQRGNWLPWNFSISEICAIISLWSYRRKKYEQALGDTVDGDGSFWDYGHGAPTVLRVLGPATNLLIRDCEWWMDRGGRFVVVRTSELKNAISSGKVTTLETKELSKTIAQANNSTAKNSTVSVAPHRIVGTEPIYYESLTFVSETPLERMYAQEILSSFMWAIAGTVQSIAGKTEPRTATPPGDHESKLDEWFDFKLKNDFFQKLAETITESGVTSNVQDAYALITPPFSAADKLPGVSYVVAETHRKLKDLQIVEKQENITKIRKAYLELFKICNSSRQIHSTITVTALLMEELCSLNNAMALYAGRANLENEGKKIRKSLDQIKNQLIKDGDKDTLGALIYLYEKQGRDAGRMGQLPSDCATEVRATCEFENRKKLEERARWNLAHGLVTDYKDRVQDIADLGWDRIPKGGFDLNAVDILGWTPLHYAANKPGDHLSLVRSILDAGGRVDPRTKSDYTPLHYAAASGHTQVASKLCGKGAAKDARNIDMRTPLHLAAEQGHLATTEFLLSKGADVEARDKYGWAPLHYAAAGGRNGVVERLLAGGAVGDARENLEMTPLHLAALNGNGQVVETLITNTSPYMTDSKQNTPLHYAAQRGNWDAVSRLYKRSELSPLNGIGSTPLHLACQHGHIKVVNELLSVGANPTLKGPKDRNQTPLEELRVNKELSKDQRNELIALLERYTESWLTAWEDSGSEWEE